MASRLPQGSHPEAPGIFNDMSNGVDCNNAQPVPSRPGPVERNNQIAANRASMHAGSAAREASAAAQNKQTDSRYSPNSDQK